MKIVLVMSILKICLYRDHVTQYWVDGYGVFLCAADVWFQRAGLPLLRGSAEILWI